MPESPLHGSFNDEHRRRFHHGKISAPGLRLPPYLTVLQRENSFALISSERADNPALDDFGRSHLAFFHRTIDCFLPRHLVARSNKTPNEFIQPRAFLGSQFLQTRCVIILRRHRLLDAWKFSALCPGGNWRENARGEKQQHGGQKIFHVRDI